MAWLICIRPRFRLQQQQHESSAKIHRMLLRLSDAFP